MRGRKRRRKWGCKERKGEEIKEREDSKKGICYVPLTCKVNASLDNQLTVFVKW